MKARLLKSCAAIGAVCTAAACTSTPEALQDGASYRSPYQPYRSLCIVPAEEHSAALDLTLARMLRDRGFTPELLESGDLPSVRRCRGIVTFSTGKALRPFEAPLRCLSPSSTPIRARPTTWRHRAQRGRSARTLCRRSVCRSCADDSRARRETVSRTHGSAIALQGPSHDGDACAPLSRRMRHLR